MKSDLALAAKGDANAGTRVGYRYLTGSMGVLDPSRAYDFLAAASPKSPAASAWMGYAAATRPELGSKGLNGVALVLNAANAGDPVGLTLLGRLYHLGKGVPQNTAMARQLYAKAGSGFALALSFLGATYLESPNAADHSKALPYFLSGTAAGDTASMVQLAGMYARGDGVAQNYTFAAQFLALAQVRGDVSAVFQRGLLYYSGLGLPKSRPQAAALFRRSALAGYAPAQAELGLCYATGQGVAKDEDLAIYWLSMAAPKFPWAATQLALVNSGKRQ